METENLTSLIVENFGNGNIIYRILIRITEISSLQAIFKDKKLERLWNKAHKVGLEEEELILLKKEFQHHQEKLDQFHQLKELQAKTKDGNLMSNHIDLNDENTQFDENTLTGKSKALKEDYDRLHRLATNSQPSDFRYVCKKYLYLFFCTM